MVAPIIAVAFSYFVTKGVKYKIEYKGIFYIFVLLAGLYYFSSNFTKGLIDDRYASLFNYINPLQKAQQGIYIPSSKSDLFNHLHYAPSNIKNLAQNQEVFSPFNPNECDIGGGSFNNHTRQQTKNIK